MSRKGSSNNSDDNGIPTLRKRLRDSNPVTVVIIGYLIYIAIGAVVLTLPFSQSGDVSFLDNTFVSTSAVSTTGLSPVNISEEYNYFGEGVILVLIQLGGIGYMIPFSL